MKWCLAAAAAAISLLLVAPISVAEAPQDVANSISEHVMSPFCPGVTLHDCPSDNAIALRAQIARWARRGWTRQQIMAKLMAEYTDIQAVPADRGASLLVWLLPAIAIVAGGTTALVFARRWSRPRTDRTPAAELGSHDRNRLEEELALVRNEL
jgi:cytochrome c-type biogenesis protein CcmH/NrfF